MLSMSSVSFAEFYVGIEANYRNAEIDQVEALSTVKNALFVPPLSLEDVILPDLYSDDSIGMKLLSGYIFNEVFSVELGYLDSFDENTIQVIDQGSVQKASAEVDSSSISVDVLSHFKVNSFDSLSIIGSAGIVYQELSITRNYQLTVTCTIETNPSCTGKRTNRKNYYDTRLQLGVGLNYDIDLNAVLRTMLKVVPDGFSVGSDYPINISAGILYKF
jgi:hypothetical protein